TPLFRSSETAEPYSAIQREPAQCAPLVFRIQRFAVTTRPYPLAQRGIGRRIAQSKEFIIVLSKTGDAKADIVFFGQRRDRKFAAGVVGAALLLRDQRLIAAAALIIRPIEVITRR